MRSTTCNAHEWFVTVLFCVAVLLASFTLCDVVFIYSRMLYLCDFLLLCFMLYMSLLFSAGSKVTKNKFNGSSVVLCCAFIMFRTLCPSSNSSRFIFSVTVEW